MKEQLEQAKEDAIYKEVVSAIFMPMICCDFVRGGIVRLTRFSWLYRLDSPSFG
jgi:hypothetical protein